MNHNVKRLILLCLAVILLFSFTGCEHIQTVKLEENSLSGAYAGKTVILHTNDVHGALDGYSYLPVLKADIEQQGGTVLLVDAGDFTSGSIYTDLSKGENAVKLMNQVGYDLVGLGNHEFEFGPDVFSKNLEQGTFHAICSNVTRDGKEILDPDIIYDIGGLKIGFFALLSPETKTKITPSFVADLTFTGKEALYQTAQKEIDKLSAKCDVVICLAHLGVDEESAGNRSTDLYANVKGIDFIIDAHSHTVMEQGENQEPIQSTGTAFENIGEIVIDNETKKIESNRLIPCEGLKQDADVLAAVQDIKISTDAELEKTFAENKASLVGEKALIRTQETGLGDLIADAFFWFITKDTELDVPADRVVAITNGGSIRDSAQPGDFSRSKLSAIFPFANTLCVNYVTGAELLESLEASTFCTPEPIGAFPQIAGMKISVDTTKAYDAGEAYPDSTYFAPKTINRVTILEVNGKPFDENATYAVISNNFCACGGDTYGAWIRSYYDGTGFDTSVAINEVVVDYITNALGGVIPEKYSQPEDRIIIK